MQSGRLRLASGFSANCSYELTSSTGGNLTLPSALFLPLRDTDEGALVLADGSERRVHIDFGPGAGEATFRLV